jgi:3-methylcrotonyl-CoA carboxylase beta subunit
MESIQTLVNSNEAQFQANAAHHRRLAEDLRRQVAKARQGGGEKYAERQRQQGKLTARERIDRLLDPG